MFLASISGIDNQVFAVIRFTNLLTQNEWKKA